MLSLYELIHISGAKPNDMIFDDGHNTKIMFHKVAKREIQYNPKYNLAGFEEFQKEHWNLFFSNTAYIFSFWYEGKTAEIHWLLQNE